VHDQAFRGEDHHRHWGRGGIGRAAVERFAAEGANIVAVDLPGPALEEARQLVERGGARAIAVPADVTRSEAVEGYVREARQQFGGVSTGEIFDQDRAPAKS
jgi:NAD(P)-dependent dehydrogenase (short-subunit alcohol dehydrogenase family)